MNFTHQSIKTRFLALFTFTLLSACDSPNDISIEVHTPLPPNTNEMTLISEASTESGLNGTQVCEMLTEGLVDFFFSDRGRELTCSMSAFSASFAVPDDSAEICEAVYTGCQENYTATVECNDEFTQKLNRCPVSLGLWRQCINEQSTLLNAISAEAVTCTDLGQYASALKSVGKRYQVPACEEIQRTCPDLDLTSTSQELEEIPVSDQNVMSNDQEIQPNDPPMMSFEDDFEDDSEDDSEDDFEDDSEDDFEDDSEDDSE